MSYQTKTDITLDVRKTNVQSVKAKQYDDETRILHFIVVDNDVQIDLTDNYRVNFKAYTPDARPILDTCEVLEDGTAQIVLNDNILFASGRMYAEIQLVNIYQETETDGILSTMPFIVQIISSVYQDSEIEPTEEFSTLVDALERVERLTVPLVFETYAQAQEAYDNGEIKDGTMVVILNDEEVDNIGPDGGGSEEMPMPIASVTKLGAVKIGNGLSVTYEGILSTDNETVVNDEVIEDINIDALFDSVYEEIYG